MRSTIFFTCLFLTGSVLHAEEKKPGNDFANFKPLAAGIEKAAALTVYIGTPREDLSPPLPPGAPKEPARKTIEIRGEEFYEEAHVAGKDELAKLKILAANEANFSKWTAPKPCGGFHADYCLEWKDGETVYQMMLCYGCEEAKIYGPDKDLHVNADQNNLRAMGQVLEKVTKGK